MGRLKYSFPMIFTLIGVVASALLMENVGFLTDNPTGELSNSYFLLIFAIAVLCFGASFFFEHWMNKTKVDFALLGILLAFFICGIIPIWLFEDMTIVNGDKSMVLSVDWIEKTRFSMTFALFILSLYSMLFVFSKSIVTPRRLIFIYVIVIIVCYVCFIYSLVAEIGSYEEIFNEGKSTKDIKSLFWNPNMLAGTMLMGISSCMIINIYKKNAFTFISIFVFYFELICTFSVISIFMGTIALLAYFLFEVISLFKKNRMAPGYVGLAIYIMVLTGLVILVAVALDGDTLGNFSKLTQHIYREFEIINYSTFSNRTGIWDFAITSLKANNINYAFGYGFGLSKLVIQAWSGLSGGMVSSVHNGPLQILFNFGITGIAIYCLFLLFTLYALVRLFRKHLRFAVTFFLVELVFIGYSMGESVIYFNSNAQGLLIGVVFYMPVLIKYKCEKYNDKFFLANSPNLSIRTLDDLLVVKAVSGILISLIVSIVPLLFFDGVRSHPSVYNILQITLICLSISILFFPYLVYLWHTDTSLFSFRLRAILNLVFMGILLGGSVGIYYLFYPVLVGTSKIYFPIALTMVYLIEVLYYSIVKKPSFKAFFSSFVAVFKTFLIAIVSSLATILFFIFIIKENFGFDGGYLKYIVIFALNLLTFYVFSILFLFKDTKAIIDYFEIRHKNNVCLALLKDKLSRK